MGLYKICVNPDCGCTFLKKKTQSLPNWRRQEHCTQACQVSHKNKKAREKYKKVELNKRRGKRLQNPLMPAKEVMIHFLSTRL